MTESITIIKTLQEYKNLTKENNCVVKFTAPWCGPCKIISPFYKELSMKHKDIIFLEVNIDNVEEVTNYENIQAIPQFKFYSSGFRYDNLTLQGSNSTKLQKNIDIFSSSIFKPVEITVEDINVEDINVQEIITEEIITEEDHKISEELK